MKEMVFDRFYQQIFSKKFPDTIAAQSSQLPGNGALEQETTRNKTGNAPMFTERGENDRFWNDDEVTTLVEGWPIKSAGQIAVLLHRSRSAVAGKINRLRGKGVLPAGIVKHYSVPPVQARPPREPRLRLVRETPLQKLLKEPAAPPLDAAPCTLLDLTNYTCRWPIGDPRDADFRYCGARKLAEVSYCAHHINLAYKEP